MTPTQEQLKLDIATRYRQLAAIAEAIGMHTLARDIRTARVPKLEAERFHLVVLGEFNHGKSTFVNALLGAEVLPTGITPYFVASYQCLNSRTNVAAAGLCAAGNAVFDAASAGTAVDLLEQRAVTINLAGELLQGDSGMRMELPNHTVAVRNPRIVTAGT